MFFVLDPVLSRTTLGHDFLRTTLDQLGVAHATWVTEETAARTARVMTSDDAVIFGNPPAGGAGSEDLVRVLRSARRARATILPVAVVADARLPPEPARTAQSWDLCDFLAVRPHLADDLEAAVDEFVRVALAQVEPTCFVSHPIFFFAHRRHDAEGLVRNLDVELRRRGHRAFRDLTDVMVGGDGRTEIAHRLARSDALVFIDTPGVGDSRPATEELRFALEERVPVIWVRVDAATIDRAPLIVWPGGSPDIETTEEADAIDAGVLVDRLIASYRAATVSWVTCAEEVMADLAALDAHDGLRVERLATIPAGFRVERPRHSTALPERPLVHLCQVFGRRVTEEDAQALPAQLAAAGVIRAADPGRACDAIVLLDPRPRAMATAGLTVTMSAQDYLAQLAPDPERDPGGRLLIAGSWTEPTGADDEVLRAVADVAEEWLRLDGGIVFGGHPTFAPVIVGAARRVHPATSRDRVTVYLSERFVSTEEVEAAALHARVVLTRDEGDRERSLALMRSRMVQHPDLVGLVAVGGRSDTRGVDDEIDLARGAHIPFVLLATPGGRAAGIAAELDRAGGWSRNAHPPLDGSTLRAMSRRTDFRGVARDLHALLERDASG